MKKLRRPSIRMDQYALLLLAGPAIVYFFVFHYLPMVGVVLAFKDYRYHLGILGSEWVGLSNFDFFFRSADAWRITRNTVGYSFLFIVVGNLTAMVVALLLNEIRNKFAMKYYQTTMIFPTFLSWVLISFITYSFLHPTLGLLNQFLVFLHFEPVSWFSEPKYWPFILTIMDVWKGVGMGSILYFASLMGVDASLYEAARIDGANRWKQTLHISIPAIVPVATILTILAIGNAFRADFGLFYQIPRDVGVLYPTTDVIDTYIFRGLRNGDVGITAATGLFQSAVGLIMIVAVNSIIRKLKPENALF
ncbi:sugar ABC transporter permease [Paenibacillus sp. IB182496]|uniref:Sugar ABC transporter permease n=1 Tax=Paenibacillus sabuli TaxID=2772509 RepID=A0A927GPV5_9BACL|nr:ABC transporter permease subunit [Paenibacillus sabuli]MBD2843869.1 sugar ABC transporter permease [Paenibacillus sabuli]